jgi:hypothetical protein
MMDHCGLQHIFMQSNLNVHDNDVGQEFLASTNFEITYIKGTVNEWKMH